MSTFSTPLERRATATSHHQQHHQRHLVQDSNDSTHFQQFRGVTMHTANQQRSGAGGTGGVSPNGVAAWLSGRRQQRYMGLQNSSYRESILSNGGGSNPYTPQRLDSSPGAPAHAMPTPDPPLWSSHSSTPHVTEEAAALRRIYEGQVREGVQAVVHALTNELPEDHILQQLLSDPATSQYARVRLCEVVELALFSAQAEQCHALALELASAEAEKGELAQHLQHVAQQLARWQEPPLRFDKCTQASAEIGGAGGGPTPAGPGAVANPMAEEEARLALMAILEETTRSNELQRTAHALVAPTRLADLTKSEGQYSNQQDFISDVLAELYRSVSGFMQYVDGSLDSLDALQLDLDQHEQQEAPDARTHHQSSGATTPPSVLSLTPPRSSPGGSAGAARLTRARWQQRGAVAVERARVRGVADSIRDGQVAVARVLERLTQREVQRGQEMQRSLELAQREAAVAAGAADGARALQTSLEKLKEDYHNAAAAARNDAHAQIGELREKLDASVVKEREREAELRATLERVAEAERRAADVQVRLDVAQGQLAEARGALADGQHTDTHQRQVIEVLRGESTSLRASLRKVTSELFCAQAEVSLSTLDTLYHESTHAKLDLLVSGGYAWLVKQLDGALREERDGTRHLQVQGELAKTASLEREVAMQRCTEDLVGLLLRMREDECVAGARCHASEELELLTYTDEVADQQGGAHAPPARRPRRGSACSSKSVSDTYASGGGTATPPPHSTALTSGSEKPWGPKTQEQYRVPTTIAGLAAALDCAYVALCTRYDAQQRALEVARGEVAAHASALRSVRATESELREELRAEKAKGQQWRAEMDLLSGEHNPMRELLARQGALLTAVTNERNALRAQWSTLSSDYTELERRNGALHARCADKEHENSRLAGLIRSHEDNAQSFSAISGDSGSAVRPVARDLLASSDENE